MVQLTSYYNLSRIWVWSFPYTVVNKPSLTFLIPFTRLILKSFRYQLNITVLGKALSKIASQKARRELSKNERRNKAVQMRHKKREEFLQKKRGLTDAPFLIALVPLNQNIKTSTLRTLFKNADSEAITNHSPEYHLHIA